MMPAAANKGMDIHLPANISGRETQISGDEAAHVSTQEAGDSGAFEGKVNGGILIRDAAHASTCSKQDGENEGKLHAVGDSAIVAQQDSLYAIEAHKDAGDRCRDCHFDQKCSQLLLSHHIGVSCASRSYNKGKALHEFVLATHPGRAGF